MNVTLYGEKNFKPYLKNSRVLTTKPQELQEEQGWAYL
jgi:hypothetical protein